MPEREARDLLEGYLGDVSRLLAWAGRAGAADVVDELRDGLIEATDAEVGRGVPPVAAAQTAIRRCGRAELVAQAHTVELAVRCSRRGARAVVVFFLLGGLLWHVGYELAVGVPLSVVPPPGSTRDLFLMATTAIQYLPPVAAVGAVVYLVASRRLDPRHQPGRVLLAGAGAAVSVVALSGALATMAAVLLTGGPELWTPIRTALTALLILAQTCAFLMSIVVARHLRRARRQSSAACPRPGSCR